MPHMVRPIQHEYIFSHAALSRLQLIQTSFLTSNSGHGPFPPLFPPHSVAVLSETGMIQAIWCQ